MLKTISEHTAVSAKVVSGGEAETMVPTVRLFDLIEGNVPQKQETKSGDEIAADVIKKAGLKVVGL